MQRTPVTSTAIASVGYDEASEVLEIEFRSGRIYQYRGVPAGVFQFFMRAPSKGGYHNRMIEGRYPFKDVTPSAPESDVDLLASLAASLRTNAPEE